MSTDHRQQHHGSCLVIPLGAQYDHLLPEIMMPCNHWALLVDLSTGEPFPLVPVGDFQLEDNIFPGTPSDSLLYTSEELTKLQKMKFQVTMHRPAQTLAVHHEDETSQLSQSSGEVPSSTSKNGDLPKATGSSDRKSSCHKCSPPSKECHGSCDKDSHSPSSKHRDKSHKDKEDSKSQCKCMASPAQRSSTTQAEKEPQLKEPPMVFHASSRSHHLSKSDEQLSFSCPTSASTPSKTTSRPCPQLVSSDSRCSMTPFETGLGESFSIPGGIGICHGSLTSATSVSGSQHVTSSGWHQATPLSPLTLQGLDPLNAEQTTGIYQYTNLLQSARP